MFDGFNRLVFIETVRDAIKKHSCMIYVPGFNGPYMTKNQYQKWKTRLPEDWFVFGVDRVDKHSQQDVMGYIFICINPAALWYEWKRFLLKPLANQDELVDLNEKSTSLLCAALSHKFHLRLE